MIYIYISVNYLFIKMNENLIKTGLTHNKFYIQYLLYTITFI